MKTDQYTKVILTVIAVNLSFLTAKNLDLIPEAYAEGHKESVIKSPQPNYARVPLNEDGSIDVRVKSFNTSDEMDVNIEEVGGYSVYGEIPVEIENQPIEVERD